MVPRSCELGCSRCLARRCWHGALEWCSAVVVTTWTEMTFGVAACSRGQDGADLLVIPIEPETLQQILEDLEAP